MQKAASHEGAASFFRAISRQMETSAGSEIAEQQQAAALDLMQSDRETL